MCSAHCRLWLYTTKITPLCLPDRSRKWWYLCEIRITGDGGSQGRDSTSIREDALLQWGAWKKQGSRCWCLGLHPESA